MKALLAERETILPGFLRGFRDPAGERNYISPAGSRRRRGGAPNRNRLRHVAKQQPAILFSLNRVRLAKGRDGGDLSGHTETPLSSAYSVQESGFMFRQRSLLSAQLLAEAKGWASELTAMEIRGPGDLEPAWRRLGQRYGIPYSTLWSLRYRDDQKDIWASIHMMLKLAVEQERSRRAAQLSNRNFIETVTGKG